MQFYFLSIVTNLLAGVTLAGDYLATRFPGLQALLPGLNQRTVRLTIGGITAAVGILKLLVYANPLQIVVVGDLLPAVAGIVLGGSLVVTSLRPTEADGVEPEAAGEEESDHVAPEPCCCNGTAGTVPRWLLDNDRERTSKSAPVADPMVHFAGADVGTLKVAEVSPFPDRDAVADPHGDGR